MKHNPAFLALVESVLPKITEVTVEQYQAMTGWVLLDVREDSEWLQGHLPNAQHLGRGIIERDIETRFPDKQSPLVLYCGGGYRSALAANNLQVMGYSKVVSLAGGYKAWLERQLPIEQD
ncbi:MULTISPECIES: rhodanese-like domain-containing protein [unclassified Shewanella]|uniref:rhodanese-like domain-containing protein n=1 Tax=unclassified Shewanella TaxID=196818 RepID=UPI001BC01307|nr:MULTISPECIES: rhodanese-like domain-containing protein [unclassified Shewanella]MCG9729753.1 sulfurtransferase [Shewanella sp. Isolate13]GIU29792.1 sulfurtransferase [Shewanella sp. MBTL60-007]